MSPAAIVVVVAASLVVVVLSSTDVVVSTVVVTATVVELSVSDGEAEFEQATREKARSSPPDPIQREPTDAVIELAAGVVGGALVEECSDCLAVISGRHRAHHCGRFSLKAGCKISIERALDVFFLHSHRNG